MRWWDGFQWTAHLGNPAIEAPTPSSVAADPVARWVLPVGRSGLAIAAGYLGLFSIILLPAPVALLLGVLALRDLRRHPDRLGRGRAWFGVIMGAAFTALLVAMLISATT